MKLITVRSDAIHAIGYDKERLLLEIVFTGGGIYRYVHVPPQLVMKFMRSPSKGRFFQKHIRGSYGMERISRKRVRTQAMRTREQSPAKRVV